MEKRQDSSAETAEGCSAKARISSGSPAAGGLCSLASPSSAVYPSPPPQREKGTVTSWPWGQWLTPMHASIPPIQECEPGGLTRANALGAGTMASNLLGVLLNKRALCDLQLLMDSLKVAGDEPSVVVRMPGIV